MSFLQSAPIAAAVVGVREEDEDCDLIIAEKDCVRTSSSSDEDLEDLSAFNRERLQCLREWSVEIFIKGWEREREEILFRKVGFEGDDRDKRQSVCLNMTPGNDVEKSERRFPP